MTNADRIRALRALQQTAAEAGLTDRAQTWGRYADDLEAGREPGEPALPPPPPCTTCGEPAVWIGDGCGPKCEAHS